MTVAEFGEVYLVREALETAALGVAVALAGADDDEQARAAHAALEAAAERALLHQDHAEMLAAFTARDADALIAVCTAHHQCLQSFIAGLPRDTGLFTRPQPDGDQICLSAHHGETGHS